MLKNLFILFIGAALAGGCCIGPAVMSDIGPSKLPDQPITRLAIAPGSGLLGDAIGLELFNRGLTVVDADESKAIMGRVGLKEFEIVEAQGLAALHEKGIEAVLIVKSNFAPDGVPESATIRIINTASGKLIVGIVWQNAWGGERGSPLDRMARKSLPGAAKDISEELLRRLGSK